MVLVLLDTGAASGAVVTAGVTVALVGLAPAWLLLVKSVADHRRAVRSGPRALAGPVGVTVRTAPAPIGLVQLDGALWRART